MCTSCTHVYRLDGDDEWDVKLYLLQWRNVFILYRTITLFLLPPVLSWASAQAPPLLLFSCYRQCAEVSEIPWTPTRSSFVCFKTGPLPPSPCESLPSPMLCFTPCLPFFDQLCNVCLSARVQLLVWWRRMLLDSDKHTPACCICIFASSHLRFFALMVGPKLFK